MKFNQIVSQKGKILQKEDLKDGQVINLLANRKGKIILIKAIFEEGKFFTSWGTAIA